MTSLAKSPSSPRLSFLFLPALVPCSGTLLWYPALAPCSGILLRYPALILYACSYSARLLLPSLQYEGKTSASGHGGKEEMAILRVEEDRAVIIMTAQCIIVTANQGAYNVFGVCLC